MVGQLGRLADHRQVQVADAPAGGADAVHHRPQQAAGVGAAPALIVIRKVVADVAQRQGAEQRVGQGRRALRGKRLSEAATDRTT